MAVVHTKRSSMLANRRATYHSCMQISVHFMSQIKRAAGCSSETVDVPGPMSLRDFLRSLADRHDSTFRGMLLDDAGEPRRTLLLFVGDDHAELDHELRDGDIVTILTPMSGG